MAAEWTSLEVAKLIASFLTPILVVVLGFVIRKAVQRIEDAQWSSRKLIERRIELYDQMAGELNDLFVFFLVVGQFRAITPPVAIARKRSLDKKFYANRFLMSEEFSDRYHAFINACFVQGEKRGHDAKLRASAAYQRGERGDQARWDEKWNDLFVDDDARVATDDEVKGSYEELMQRFAAECGVTAVEDQARLSRA